MSAISAKKTVTSDQWLAAGNPETCHLKPKGDEAAVKEKLLVSMKQKAAILRHLQEKDLVQDADAKELKEILGDLDKTIKELETANV